jgi:hypothetical protein
MRLLKIAEFGAFAPCFCFSGGMRYTQRELSLFQEGERPANGPKKGGKGGLQPQRQMFNPMEFRGRLIQTTRLSRQNSRPGSPNWLTYVEIFLDSKVFFQFEPMPALLAYAPIEQISLESYFAHLIFNG